MAASILRQRRRIQQQSNTYHPSNRLGHIKELLQYNEKVTSSVLLYDENLFEGISDHVSKTKWTATLLQVTIPSFYASYAHQAKPFIVIAKEHPFSSFQIIKCIHTHTHTYMQSFVRNEKRAFTYRKDIWHSREIKRTRCTRSPSYPLFSWIRRRVWKTKKMWKEQDDFVLNEYR